MISFIGIEMDQFGGICWVDENLRNELRGLNHQDSRTLEI